MYHSSSNAFMMKNMPSGKKKYHTSTIPESHEIAKMFFFLSSSSSSLDGLVQNRVTFQGRWKHFSFAHAKYSGGIIPLCWTGKWNGLVEWITE